MLYCELVLAASRKTSAFGSSFLLSGVKENSMSRSAPGSTYFACIDGKHRKAIMVQMCQDQSKHQKFYLLAVAAHDDEERAQEIRGTGGFTKIVAVQNLTYPKHARPGVDYLDWSERTPELHELTELLKNQEAMPARVKAGGTDIEVLLSETEPIDNSDLERSHETNFAMMNMFAPFTPQVDPPNKDTGGKEPRSDTAEGTDKILHAISQLAARVDRMESQGSQASTINTAGGGGGWAADIDDEFERAQKHKPTEKRNVTHRQVVTGPEAPLPPPQETAETPFNQAMLTSIASAVASAVADVHKSGRNATSAHAQLFKLHGAKGRVAQDQLDRDFDENPGEVIIAFERAVERRAGGLANPAAAHCGGAADALLQVWRETVPAKEAGTVARIGEAVIDAYRSIRNGNTERGAARLALLIGAMEQSVLDNHRWQPRAATITGMPPTPMHAYQALPAEAKKGQDASSKKVGQMAMLCDPTRATTALAVFKDSEGN